MSSDMDQEWKPTKMRPQSCVDSPHSVSATVILAIHANLQPRSHRTMAQDFSTALDSAFSLDSDVNHLSQTIDQK